MGAPYYLLGCLTLVSVVLASTISTRAKFTIAGNQLETNKPWRNWDLVINRLSFPYFNPEYFGPATQITLEGRQSYSYDWQLLKTLPLDVTTVFRTYGSHNGKNYIPSLVHTETLCGELQKVTQGMVMFKCFHYVEAGINECPFPKGNYSVKHVKVTLSLQVTAPQWCLDITGLLITFGTKDVLIFNRLFDFSILQNHNIG